MSNTNNFAQVEDNTVWCEQCELKVGSIDELNDGWCASCCDRADAANEEDLFSKSFITAKVEILNDVLKGDVPASVESFSELHDYVDANVYGGVCDDGFPQKFATTQDWYDFCDKVQNAVDEWIKSGDLKWNAKGIQEMN